MSGPQVSTTDLLEGNQAYTIVSGGYQGCCGGDNPGARLATNGQPDCDPNQLFILSDQQDAMTIEWALPPCDVTAVNVFTGWGDRRCRPEYELSLKLGDGWTDVLATETGASAEEGSYRSTVSGFDDTHTNVTGVRLAFKGQGSPPMGPVLHEIDVEGTYQCSSQECFESLPAWADVYEATWGGGGGGPGITWTAAAGQGADHSGALHAVREANGSTARTMEYTVEPG